MKKNESTNLSWIQCENNESTPEPIYHKFGHLNGGSCITK